MSTLMVMIKDPIIMEKVQEELELSRSPESIAGQISVTRVDESQVIMISVTDQDPKIAMEIANATARSFKSEVGNLLDFDEVQLLSEAKENNFPINENKNRTVIIAFVFGLITGDRKSTRLNFSHVAISYAVFCLKKKKKEKIRHKNTNT